MVYKDKEKEKKYRLEWQRKNRDKMKEYRLRYLEKYPNSLKKSMEKWRKNNPDYRKEYYEKNKEKETELSKKWRNKNKKKVNDYSKKHYQKHSEKRKNAAKINYIPSIRKNRYERNRETFLIQCKKRNEKKRSICIWHYSNGAYQCACCGLKDYKIFFDMDHINNNGNEHRKIIGRTNLHGWLIKNNLPKGYQVLCSNCNQGKNRNGGICPHKSKS